MVSNKLDSIQEYSCEQRRLSSVNHGLIAECAGKFAGPMEVTKFLEEYIPEPAKGETMPTVSWEKVVNASIETDMYEPFVAVCEALDQSGKMIYRNISKNSDRQTVPAGHKSRDGLKPDIMTYQKDLRPLPEKERIPDFSLADRVDECKPDRSYDPFQDSKSASFESVTDKGDKTRGQISGYASAVFQLQFRFFCFSILLMKTHARLIRWERAGAVVTEVFDVANTTFLAQFIWRYSHMNRAQRGFDESVRPADELFKEDEIKKIRRELITAEEERKPETRGMHSKRKAYYLLMASRPPTDDVVAKYPRNPFEKQDKVSFRADEDLEPHQTELPRSPANGFVLLSPLIAFDRGPFGKSTRSFIVYHCATKKLFHLKDTHRVPAPKYTPEHEVLEQLRKVDRIPTVLRAWDVAPYGECYDTVFGTMFESLNAIKDEPGDDTNTRRAQRILRPYRLITREIAHDITTFENWRQVSVVIYDALGVLKHAEIAKWRHRDISLGNIMIYNGRGFVIDWELAQRPESLNKGNPRVPDQTGTWQFISARRLIDPKTQHEAMDDMESTFWVLLYLALKYGNHHLDGDKLRGEIDTIFNQVLGWKEVTGGREKARIMKDLQPAAVMPAKFTPKVLNSILESMQTAFQPAYTKPKSRQARPGANEKIRRSLKMVNDYDLALHNEALELLKTPTHLRKVIKDFAPFNWSDDCGPIKHELSSSHTPQTATSVKRSVSNKKKISTTVGPFPGSRPSASRDWKWDGGEGEDQEEDEEELGRPSKKQQTVKDSNAPRVAASQSGNMRPQPQALAHGADLDDVGTQPRDENGEEMIAVEASMGTGDVNSQVADNGTEWCLVADDARISDVEAGMADPGPDDFDLGLRSEGGSPPPLSSAAPSSPSSVRNDYDEE